MLGGKPHAHIGAWAPGCTLLLTVVGVEDKPPHVYKDKFGRPSPEIHVAALAATIVEGLKEDDKTAVANTWRAVNRISRDRAALRAAADEKKAKGVPLQKGEHKNSATKAQLEVLQRLIDLLSKKVSNVVDADINTDGLRLRLNMAEAANREKDATIEAQLLLIVSQDAKISRLVKLMEEIAGRSGRTDIELAECTNAVKRHKMGA